MSTSEPVEPTFTDLLNVYIEAAVAQYEGAMEYEFNRLVFGDGRAIPPPDPD